ncbi:MFS transporter [Pseudorhodobacter ferrugineus]|uniref:MFS transporter n=2 Tax=Pseudorhodobacter ferrugineus TaxID=77008 RepID=UPI0003B74F4F|nr:MFS transporter [Pseudorhodobacter ferrugineus]
MMSFSATLVAVRPALAAFGAMGVLWGGFAATLPDIKTMLGVDEAGLGLLLLGTPLAAVLAMLVAPAAGVVLGRVALPIAGVAMALAFILPGQAPMAGGAMLAGFAVAMAVCGATTGLLDVLMNARVAAMENARGHSLMNLCHAAYSLGYAASALWTGALRGAAWPPGQVMLVAALVALGLGVLSYERDGTIDGLGRPKDGSSAALGRATVIGGAIVLIAFLSENAAESWSALHIEQTLGGSPAQGAFGPAAMALTMAVARLGGQSIIARVSPLRLLTFGSVIAGLGALIAAAAVSPAMAYVGFIVLGIGASVVAPTAFTLVGQMAPPNARARAVARATLLGYLGYFFGPPVIGFIAASFGLRAAFGCAAVALLAVTVLAPMMLRSKAP